MVSAQIHEELREKNSLSPLAACRWASERLEAGIRLLLAEAGMDQILVVTSHGNHPRDTLKIHNSGAADHSYEHDMYLDLRQRIQDSRLAWSLGVGYHNYVDIEGYCCRFHHGHNVRYAGGVGGITIPMNKAIAQWDKSQRAIYSFCGHWHQFIWNWSWVLNGSVIGYNPFAVSIKAEYQPPLQTFWVIDQERGLTRVLPIFCR